MAAVDARWCGLNGRPVPHRGGRGATLTVQFFNTELLYISDLIICFREIRQTVNRTMKRKASTPQASRPSRSHRPDQ